MSSKPANSCLYKVRVPDKLDDDVGWLGLARNVLGAAVGWIRGVNSNSQLAAISATSTKKRSSALFFGRVLASVDGAGDVVICDGGNGVRVDVFSEREDSTGAEERERPFGAFELFRHGPERVVVGVGEVLQVQGGVLDVLGLEVLRDTPVDAVTDKLGAFAADSSLGEEIGRHV